MPRWLLVAMLYADGQSVKQIACQLGVGYQAVVDQLKSAKAHMLGATGARSNGAVVGRGTKLALRAALVEDGHL